MLGRSPEYFLLILIGETALIASLRKLPFSLRVVTVSELFLSMLARLVCCRSGEKLVFIEKRLGFKGATLTTGSTFDAGSGGPSAWFGLQ
jgi:hypothetical protein